MESVSTGKPWMKGKSKESLKRTLSLRAFLLVGVHLACLGVLLLVFVNGIQRHFRFNTRALITVKDTREVEDFVAFTICPTYSEAYKAEQLDKYGITKREYKDGNYTGNSTGGNAWGIFHNITWNIEDLGQFLTYRNPRSRR